MACSLGWITNTAISLASPILQPSYSMFFIRLFMLVIASLLGTLLALAFTAPALITGKTPFSDVLAIIVLGMPVATVFYFLEHFLTGELTPGDLSVVLPAFLLWLAVILIPGLVIAISVWKLKGIYQQLDKGLFSA